MTLRLVLEKINIEKKVTELLITIDVETMQLRLIQRKVM